MVFQVKVRVLFFVCTVFLSTLVAAPYRGDSFSLKQPDGSLVPVSIWGDEFYQRVESIDGYTLVRDAQQWICYAKLSADSTQLLPTLIRYAGVNSDPTAMRFGLEKKYEIKPNVRLARRNAMMKKFRVNNKPQCLTFPNSAKKRGVDNVYGLTLLIEFSDEPQKIPADSIKAFLNASHYKGYNNNGSIREYFQDVSGNKLNYENICLGYMKAKKTKAYYDDTTEINEKALELINEILIYVRDTLKFNFSTLSTLGDSGIKFARALNVLYAGVPTSGWSKGLWPHCAGMKDVFFADGVGIDMYQISNIGTELNIGTFCHENGHLLYNYPDLYDYDGDSQGAGEFCLMSTTFPKNPLMLCAPLRFLAGWDLVTDLSTITNGSKLTVQSNSNTSYKYCNPKDSLEMFFIESRLRTGRSIRLPDDGLVIWHVDWNMETMNNCQKMTADSHYTVSLEQADNRFDLEKDSNTGDEQDLFNADGNNQFSDSSLPNAYWWKNTPSGLTLSQISSSGESMTFYKGNIPLAITYPNHNTIVTAFDTIRICWNTNTSLINIQSVKLSYKGTFTHSNDSIATFVGDICASAPNYGYYTWVVPNISLKNVSLLIQRADSNDYGFETEKFTIQRRPSLSLDPAKVLDCSIKQGQSSVLQLTLHNKSDGTLSYAVSSTNNTKNILINEVYIESSRGLELWNRGGDVDLTGWKLVWKDSYSTRVHEFSKHFLFKSGKFLVLKKGGDAFPDNDSLLEMKADHAWHSEGTKNRNYGLSLCLYNEFGEAIDFVKTIHSPEQPPVGCVWNGMGADVTDKAMYRRSNQNTFSAQDWSCDSIVTRWMVNPGQNNDQIFKPWLELEKKSGVIDSMKSLSVSIPVHGTYLTMGKYYDTLVIKHNDPRVANPYKLLCIATVLNKTAMQVQTLKSHEKLLTVYPNPASMSQTEGLRFVLNQQVVSTATIRIYNSNAMCVRVLDYPKTKKWDLCDETGKTVEPGVYLLKTSINLLSGNKTTVQEIVGIRW